jgi:hypothetical protein
MSPRTQNHQETPRMNYLERPQVQTSSYNGPIGMAIDQPVYHPQGPQVIIIQRASVDLLNHVPMYNGESTAAAISFIGAAENAKRNDAETSARMIVAVGARLSGRASQWFETVSSSKLRDNGSIPGIMVDTLPNNDHGWNFFTKTFLANFTSSTETFDLRDQLKKLVWNPEKEAIKAHILTMTTILHSMALLGDALTDRDKVEYFMSSLVKKSHLVRKINLTSSFDQACRDIVDYVSKEQIAKTIIDQHAYKQPAGAKLYNLEPCSDDDDYETHCHANRSTATLNLLYDAELNAMRMAWLDKLNPEEKRRFDNQLCIGCGEPGHVRRDCPHIQASPMTGSKTIYPRNVDNTGAQQNSNFPRPQSSGNTMNKPKNGPGPLPKNNSYPVNNNASRIDTPGNLPKHNMGG